MRATGAAESLHAGEEISMNGGPKTFLQKTRASAVWHAACGVHRFIDFKLSTQKNQENNPSCGTRHSPSFTPTASSCGGAAAPAPAASAI